MLGDAKVDEDGNVYDAKDGNVVYFDKDGEDREINVSFKCWNWIKWSSTILFPLYHLRLKVMQVPELIYAFADIIGNMLSKRKSIRSLTKPFSGSTMVSWAFLFHLSFLFKRSSVIYILMTVREWSSGVTWTQHVYKIHKSASRKNLGTGAYVGWSIYYDWVLCGNLKLHLSFNYWASVEIAGTKLLSRLILCVMRYF